MKLLLVPVLLIVAASCARQGFTAANEAAIRSVLQQQQEGWNNGSIEEYMQGYEQSDSVRFISGGTVTYGWETVLQRYQKGYSDKAAMGTLRFSEILVKGLSDTEAIAYGKWELEREKDHPWGMFTLVFKNTGNGWRIVHDHTSLAR